MFITINPVLDMETLAWVGNDGVYEWAGPIVLAKGDSLAKQEEQSTVNFNNSLMQIFQSQYATQQTQLKYLQGQMEPIIAAGGTGYTPAQLTALRTGATDTNSQQYRDADAALNNQVSQASGGSKLTGVAGANVETKAALDNAEAQTQATSQEQITEANANLQQQNYWNAVNALNGVAAQESPLGYAGASNSAGNTVSGLSQAYTASDQSQLLGALGGIAGGAGSALTGSKFMSCWVFASFWGWSDVRTHIMRRWLFKKSPKWFRTFYLTHGEQISKTPGRWIFRSLATFVLLQESF